MKAFFEKLVSLDRRWIFMLLFVVLMFPILNPLRLPGLKASPLVKRTYAAVEALPEGSPILVSFDFDPASKPELAPMATALLRHAFKKKLKVVSMGLWVTGIGMAREILNGAAAEANAKYGEDFVDLGWKQGGVAVITAMGDDIHSTFPIDARENRVDTVPIMQKVRRLKDFALVISLAAGSPGIDHWIAYGSDKHHFKLAGGTTAVNVPSMAPYIQSGQLIGLIGAMRGAAEYELLAEKPGDATTGMDAISLAHYLIVFFIILGNIAYFVIGGKKAVTV